MTTDTASAPLPDIDALWNFKDPAATESAFRELLPAAEASGDSTYLAVLLTQIARTQGLQQKFDEAHATLDRVEAMLGDAPLPRVRYLLERGRAFNSSKRADEACPLFIEAFELGIANGLDNLAVDAAHMIAIAVKGDESLEWNEKGMAVAESSSDPRAKRWLGALYNNNGWFYHDAGTYERALESFEKCLAWHAERNTGDGHRIARWSVARTLRSLGRVEEALAIQSDLAAGVDAAAKPDGYVSEELAECLLALGRGDEAAPHFRTAYELLSEDIWLKRDAPERLERMRVLGASA